MLELAADVGGVLLFFAGDLASPPLAGLCLLVFQLPAAIVNAALWSMPSLDPCVEVKKITSKTDTPVNGGSLRRCSHLNAGELGLHEDVVGGRLSLLLGALVGLFCSLFRRFGVHLGFFLLGFGSGVLFLVQVDSSMLEGFRQLTKGGVSIAEDPVPLHRETKSEYGDEGSELM